MYKRLESIFCGCIRVVESPVYMERGELLLKPSVVVLSEVDRAIAECKALCIDRVALGSSAVGKVVDTGVRVDPSLEGRRIVVKPWCGLAPVLRDGFAQELARVPEECIEVVPREVGDVDAALAAFLSVTESVLDEVVAREVLIVGRDLVSVPIALAAKRLSSRVFSIPSETPVAKHLGLEAASVYGNRRFDVVIIASLDPFVIHVATRMCRDGGIVVAHPLALELGMVKPRASCRVKAIELEGLARGLKVLSDAKGVVHKLLKSFRGLDPQAPYSAPAILHLSSKEERYSNRDRR